jgi:hypothetical protein
MDPAETTAVPAPEITRWGRFASPEMEALYRRHHLRQDTLQTSIVLAVVIAGVLLFIPNDYATLGPTRHFRMLLAARVTVAALTAALMFALRRGLTPAVRDRLLFAWMLLGALLMLAIGAARSPQHFPFYALTSVLAVLLIYLGIPTPLPAQMTVALLLTCGDGALLAVGGGAQIDPLFRRTLIVGYLVASVVGPYASWSLHRLKREQFAILLRESGVRSVLEEALAEIRTLRGIIPICSYCKRVRNDDGYWQQVEAYVTDRTEAQFSHGICPHCRDKAFEGTARR